MGPSGHARGQGDRHVRRSPARDAGPPRPGGGGGRSAPAAAARRRGTGARAPGAPGRGAAARRLGGQRRDGPPDLGRRGPHAAGPQGLVRLGVRLCPAAAAALAADRRPARLRPHVVARDAGAAVEVDRLGGVRRARGARGRRHRPRGAGHATGSRELDGRQRRRGTARHPRRRRCLPGRRDGAVPCQRPPQPRRGRAVAAGHAAPPVVLPDRGRDADDRRPAERRVDRRRLVRAALRADLRPRPARVPPRPGQRAQRRPRTGQPVQDRPDGHAGPRDRQPVDLGDGARAGGLGVPRGG